MVAALERGPVWQHVREEFGGTVVFHPKDGDRFALPMEDVVHACRSWEKAGEFSSQVSTLLDRLAKWLAERADQIDSAYLGLEPDDVLFVVVRREKTFDPAFEDGLTMLDLAIAQSEDLSLIKMRVLALPCATRDSVASFLDIERALRYVGGRAKA